MYPSKVERPKYTVLSTHKIENLLNIKIPIWHSHVNLTVKNILKTKYLLK